MTIGKLIGLVGYAGAGKTSIAKEAIERANNGRATVTMPVLLQYNFSHPIITMLQAMGIPKWMLHDKSCWNIPLDIICGKTIRQAATTLGTDWGRNQIGKDVWTNITLGKTAAKREAGYHIVIDNVRFPSEMDALIAVGAVFISVRRFNHQINTSHESDMHFARLQSMCQYEVLNDGPIAEISERMRKIIVDIIAM